MTLSSSPTVNSPDHGLSSLKMALRSGSSTKSWMHDDVGEEYSTLFVMRDMGRNTTSGVLALKWPTQMPSTDGKTKMGQRFETHSNFSSGEGCKPGPTTQTYYDYRHDYRHPLHSLHHPLHSLHVELRSITLDYARYTHTHPTLSKTRPTHSRTRQCLCAPTSAPLNATHHLPDASRLLPHCRSLTALLLLISIHHVSLISNHSQNNQSLHITTCPHQRPINITDHPINAVSPFAIAPDVAFSLHGQLETAFLLIQIILPIYTFCFLIVCLRSHFCAMKV